MSEPLDAAKLLAHRIPQTRDEYDPRDAIIYALGVGAGLSPEVDELRFLYERRLQVMPTMALVLGTPGFWPMDPASGLDWLNILHGEQRLRLLRPLDPTDTLTGDTRVTHLADKGAGKAAMVRAVKQLKSTSGTLVAEATETWVVRGAGGFGGERDLPGDPLPPVPERAADVILDLPTSLAQAATYRLSGDRNPLHIDSAYATRAGFERPILHGLSSLGVAARALIHGAAGGDASRLSSIAARFTAPVFPGDTIRAELWIEGSQVHFRASVRNAIVIDHGLAELDGFAGQADGALKQ